MTMNERQVREIIDEYLQEKGGDIYMPEGQLGIRGIDPGYDTRPMRLHHNMPSDGVTVDGESESPIDANETLPFEFTVNNDVDGGGCYGVIVKTPGTPRAGAYLIDGPGPNNTRRSVSCAVDGFNTPRGRFFQGVIRVRGTIENGDRPGLIQIAYGEPQSQEDLGDFETGVVVSDPEVLTGTDELTLGVAGVYLITVHQELIPSYYTNSAYIIRPSAGLADFRSFAGMPQIE